MKEREKKTEKKGQSERVAAASSKREMTRGCEKEGDEEVEREREREREHAHRAGT